MVTSILFLAHLIILSMMTQMLMHPCIFRARDTTYFLWSLLRGLHLTQRFFFAGCHVSSSSPRLCDEKWWNKGENVISAWINGGGLKRQVWDNPRRQFLSPYIFFRPVIIILPNPKMFFFLRRQCGKKFLENVENYRASVVVMTIASFFLSACLV